jgi:hypothetical protein
MSEWVIVAQQHLSNFSGIWWWEEVIFQWDDDDDDDEHYFVLHQHT